ncbi:cytochrome P450 [Aspergillus steynii IBT 23096]|uniref:Cytochrome P450 n=1 Tax=Aspergillus steynii IBT 23096 TaxID=1392250 RepID=A0A2I2GPC7_9EURO|nr:cytochrome P450 [Aspergillus steynii IBT 23096]PLB54726.1 cytochrome P450 [Aspergillus steynii IBT 23096]
MSYSIIYNLFLSPLAPYPGPKLWAISNIPYLISITRGRSHIKILELHSQYGPALRVGPRELSFNSPQAFQDIYASRPGQPQFPKDPKFYASKLNRIDECVAGNLDDEAHTRQRRLLSREATIVYFVSLLVQRLRGQIKDEKHGAKVDMKAWFNFTTFDITGQIMFSEPFDCLQNSHLHPWIALIFDSVKGMTVLSAMNRFSMFRQLLEAVFPESLRRKMLRHFDYSSQKADRRLEKGSDHEDFMAVVSTHGVHEPGAKAIAGQLTMTRAELYANSSFISIAGSETTASLLCGCVYYLCKNRDCLDRLCREVRTEFSTDDQIVSPQCNRLTYLNAVIEESLRLYPPAAAGLPRLVPKEGAIVNGRFLPQDAFVFISSRIAIYPRSNNLQITVSGHQYATNHSAANFKLPEQFIPERWLGTDR